MNRIAVLGLSLACLASLVVVGSSPARAQSVEPDRLDAPRLKAIIDGFGFEVKELSKDEGKEKWEIGMKTPNFNIPVACELSASKKYAWLTVSLGPGPAPETAGSAEKMDKILRANAQIQPTQFYITSKGLLMLGLAVENRDLTPALLRRSLDKVVEDVDKTSSTWN